MSTSSPTRPLTRSQTCSASVLGKRTASLSRASSVVSNRSPAALLTPDVTPKMKRLRTGLEEDDSRANKENIPPLRDLVLDSLAVSRHRRRSSVSSDVTTVSTFSQSSLRRHSTQPSISQTPSRALGRLSLATPPSTPPFTIPLSQRVRALLRATSNAGNTMSTDGREAERTIIESFLHSFDADADVSESVLYISGAPGTGKTALVNAIVASAHLGDAVRVVFLNCMAITGLDALWQRLVEELSCAVAPKGRAGKRGAGKRLSGRDEVGAILEKQRDLQCILILDELDNISNGSPNALQPLFALAASYPSTIRIMGIANTHTLTSASSLVPLSLLPDVAAAAITEPQTPSTPTRSRTRIANPNAMKVKTIHFAPYTAPQLLAILHKRFEGLPQDELRALLPPTALMLLTKKVAALTGDVRVLFEVLRGAIDLAVPASSPSSTDAPVPPSDAPSKPASVSPAHVLSALKLFTPSTTSKSKSGSAAAASSSSTAAGNSETATKVRNLGLQARLALLALLLASKRIAAGLSLSLSASSSSSAAKAPTSPTKRSPAKVKRTTSNNSNSGSSLAPDAGTGAGVDSMQLHTFYTSLLSADDTFAPVARSDFTDLLGVLETTGLVALGGFGGGAGRATVMKRSASSASAGRKGSGNRNPVVGLQAHVREAEVARGLGLGLGLDAAPASASGAEKEKEGDVLEDGVRTIWTHEMGRIRREAKARSVNDANASAVGMDGVVGFDDAMED
ncbi:hypothetical protein M0805_005554 [Coniferiporia weirii]|nr:hypothetical protein M0805_005554 [Coniferiporia weirii]